MAHPGGRPSEYKPAYGRELLELMASGLSLTAAAAELGFTRQTAWNWGKEHPEFFDLLELGKGKRALMFERGLISTENAVKAANIRFALTKVAPEEWAEVTRTEVSGPGGGPIKVEDPVDPMERARALAFLWRQAVEKQGE